jgi:hypothetical protein
MRPRYRFTSLQRVLFHQIPFLHVRSLTTAIFFQILNLPLLRMHNPGELLALNLIPPDGMPMLLRQGLGLVHFALTSARHAAILIDAHQNAELIELD